MRCHGLADPDGPGGERRGLGEVLGEIKPDAPDHFLGEINAASTR